MITCPKCHYQRRPGDSHVHAGVCPDCGIAYAKYRPKQGKEEDETVGTPTEYVSLWRRLLNTACYVPETSDPMTLWARAALYVLFLVWGLKFIFAGIDWQTIGGSFMHSVNLPFHEFGHVLFGFFGRFMGILGGSLFQVMLPLVFVVAFSLQMRDNFAAAICLWWCGQNFIDVSPYIADAPHRDLPLILGMSESAHDWGNLLTMTNSLGSADAIATASFTLGTLIMLVSFTWGGYILWLQTRNRRH